NEYELLLSDSETLTFRIATSSDSGWNKTVTVPLATSPPPARGWHHAIFWIIPGSQIGLRCDGGYPDTEILSSGQSAYKGGGDFVLGSSVTSSGINVDEIAVFTADVTPFGIENLWNDGAGLFYRHGQWVTCSSSSSSSSSSMWPSSSSSSSS